MMDGIDTGKIRERLTAPLDLVGISAIKEDSFVLCDALESCRKERDIEALEAENSILRRALEDARAENDALVKRADYWRNSKPEAERNGGGKL